MTDFLIAHLWQSTIFAGFVWALAMLLRRNGAHVRYWIWFAASLKFLIPFALLLRAGSLIEWHPTVPEYQRSWIATAEELGQPVLRFPPPATASPAARISNGNDYVATAVATLWFAGFLLVAALWLTRLARVRTLCLTAKAFSIDNCPIPILSTTGPIEPGVFGIRKPVLLLPGEIVSHLTEPQLRAIIAHELCHVQRRDNLTAAIHISVQTIFWFHPLVWWIGTRLLEERELACDEAVLRIGEKPRDYAEGILKVCRLYVGSPIPFFAGVGGSDLRKRIEKIMRNRMPPGLSTAKKLIVGLAGITVLALPVGFGLVDTTPRWSAFAQKPAAVPRFEVASVKPCNGDERVPEGGGGRGESGGGPASSPGRLRTACMPVRFFIETAYIHFADTRFDRTSDLRLVGGPAWIDSAEYQIDAKAPDNTSQSMMRGKMLQGLLEDRFQLRIHREARKIPVYELVVARQGFKLLPTDGRSCTARDLTQFPPPPFDPSQKQACGIIKLMAGPHKVRFDLPGASITEFSKYLPDAAGRPVVDKTGIKGLFDFHMEFARGGVQSSEPPADNNDAQSVFSALAQIGLRLQPAKGSKEFLVIDGIARPSEN